MASKRHDRSQARRAALQVLYSGEISGASPSRIIDEGLAIQDEIKLSNYATSLVYGVDSHRIGIDRCLDQVSDNWALDRMPMVDRSILRLAVYEMLYVDAVPVSVSINEAVELAKDFGGEDESSRFVNGVLGRIAKLIEEGSVPSSTAGFADFEKPEADEAVETDEVEAASEAVVAVEADESGDDAEADEAAAEAEVAEAEEASADDAEKAGAAAEVGEAAEQA